MPVEVADSGEGDVTDRAVRHLRAGVQWLAVGAAMPIPRYGWAHRQPNIGWG